MDISTSRLMRSRDDAIIAGVAGGIARYLEVDSTVVRLIFVVLAFTGVGVLLYPLLWVIMPLEKAPATGDGMYSAPFMRDRGVQQSRAGAPSGDAEVEIPLNNLNHYRRAASPYTQRNRQLGVVLIGVGILVLLSILLGPAFGRLVFPLVLIAVGVLVLLRHRR